MHGAGYMAAAKDRAHSNAGVWRGGVGQPTQPHDVHGVNDDSD
jgi:hypothetical protein